jgi:glycosyltransferase involved in cell wall biosynthesis
MLSGTRLLVFPSHEEGYGMAVGEAIAHGCQVVAYDLPVFQTEFGSNLIRVDCFDTNVFAKKIIDCLDNDKKINCPDSIRSWEQASKEEFKIIENQLVI